MQEISLQHIYAIVCYYEAKKNTSKGKIQRMTCPSASVYELPCCSAPQDRAWILLEEPQEDRMVLEVQDKQQQLLEVISKSLEITMIMIFIMR